MGLWPERQAGIPFALAAECNSIGHTALSFMTKAGYHSLLEMFMGRKIIQARNASRILP